MWIEKLWEYSGQAEYCVSEKSDFDLIDVLVPYLLYY